MQIKEMFVDDINREINGVVMVDQDAEKVIKQEVQEYIITKELKKHFISFFDSYSDSFDHPTTDMGVWISGFFGSGKSHFLKMLSYILENKVIDGVSTVEQFRDKFADDPASFMMIDRSTRCETETILFNIDIEGSMYKDKTAVLRVFAKMFFNHLGFCGENLKVAKLEQYIESMGKTEEFRRVFEEKRGLPWVKQRKAFAFNGKAVISTLMEVLDMSEQDARNWFEDKSAVEYSISALVDDIKAYVDSKPDNFRLLFMADEAGQYVGTDTDMLLNLQSLVEKLGSVCKGKVWVVCTGQEAIDEIIKVRADEFSRIQARFKTRLSLSSSSADEVIQKRVLKKSAESEKRLEAVYDANDSALRNLYTFRDSVLDIKGYEGPQEFADDFPFVPYQFILLQKVFAEVRKHGNAGKNLSGGERSMLSGFQEAAQKVQDRDEFALVPFFRFYDTVHTFLEGAIRRVIERCQKAADNNLGIEQIDVDVLKLLYLIRYVDDIPANLDNIVILMADDIRTDKIELREKIRASLNRLLSQNYIGRNGEVYNFLTDEEQDIAREIRNTNVDTSAIVTQIGRMIFGDIYPNKKYRYGKYDFSFDQFVDTMAIGTVSGGMKLRFLTIAVDQIEREETRLLMQSKGEVCVLLSDSKYFESLESAMKIRKYVKQRNVAQLPASMQSIIRKHQEQASAYEASAAEELENAIVNAEFYADGEHLTIKGGGAESKINQALEYLVAHVYYDLGLIGVNAETDDDIREILKSNTQMLPDTETNGLAAAKMEEFLELQHMKNRHTSMADIQSRYQAIPYGWREIDIAAVAAQLIAAQKVTIKYAGATIQPDDPRLPDMLRKKSEIGKTTISKRILNSAANIRTARDFLRDYFDVMDVPSDEDGLVAFIIEKFGEQKEHYAELDKIYDGHKYPDHALLSRAIQLTDEVLSQRKDNIALVQSLIKLMDKLDDNKEKMQRVESFFKNQVKLFDAAVNMEKDLQNDLDYLAQEESTQEANEALKQIRVICMVQPDKSFDYKRIPELNELMSKVKDGHDILLDAKRKELLEIVRQCMEAIHTAASDNYNSKDIVAKADKFYDKKKNQIAECKSIALLDGLVQQMLNEQSDDVKRIEALNRPVKPPVEKEKKETKKAYKAYNRSILFPPRLLENEDDIKDYVEKMQEKLRQILKDCDGIELK